MDKHALILKDFVKVKIVEQDEKIQNGIRTIDAKIVQLRKDTDVDTFLRLIRQKADCEVVNADFKNHEFKISHIDNNVMRMASDFEIIQDNISQIDMKVAELIEVNKEVLLGKRRLNCLSCGNENSVPIGQGIDGKVYKSITPVGKQTNSENTTVKNASEIHQHRPVS